MKKALKYVGLGLAALIAAILISPFFTSAPTSARQISNSFISAVQSGDTDRAYSLTSEGFKATSSHEDLQKIISENWAYLPKSQPELSFDSVDNTNSDQTTAQLEYLWNIEDGGKYRFMVNLEKIGNDWFVANAFTVVNLPEDETDSQ